MSTDNNNKDPIERLFQKKAEEYDIQYREEDWLNLEEQLDKQDAILSRRRKRWFIAAAILLLFSLLGYAIYQNSLEIDQLNEQLEEQRYTQDAPADRPSSSDSADETAPDSNNDSGNKATASTSSSGTSDQADGQAASSDSKVGTEEENTTVTDFLVTQNAIQGVEANALPCSNCPLGTLPEPTPQAALNTAPVQINERPSYFAAAQTEPPNSSAPADLHSTRPTSNASVGILVGPDLSTTGSLSDFHSPGYSLGLSVAYKLGPNISIQTGLMRSTVRYAAGSEDYHPPENFWGYGQVADRTIAECVIIDIPVSIKYDWAHFDRSRLFATAGVSSYIMLSEDYQFEYDQPDGEQAQGWYGETGSRHWSSNINLSIGYEYDLNNRFGLRVEPFLKLPVREIGWGNVKLYSLGSFISFSYNLY